MSIYSIFKVLHFFEINADSIGWICNDKKAFVLPDKTHKPRAKESVRIPEELSGTTYLIDELMGSSKVGLNDG